MRNVIYAMASAVGMAALLFDRRVLKRFLNIETPLYRLWWETHSANMQRKLDKAHSLKFDF